MRNFNKFRSVFVAATVAVSSFAFTSCDDDDDTPPVWLQDQDGVFIINEGNFKTPNASISFLYDNADRTVLNDLFQKANGQKPLGDVAMDLDLIGNQAYITLNNSNKVEIVNAATFREEAVIENLKLPRFFTALNQDKAYITEWVDYGEPGRVSVINLKTNQVVKSLTVGEQPEQLVIVGDKLYVANQVSNTVTIINTTTDAVEATVPVADAPNSLAVDANNNVWVLSSGTKNYIAYPEIDPAQSTAGALTKINGATGAITSTFNFPDVTASAEDLTLNGAKNTLYYTYNGKVYKQETNAGSLSHTVIVDRSFYGIGIDPETGYIYGAEQSFTGNGTVSVFRPDGTMVTSFTAGIGPNGFVFK